MHDWAYTFDEPAESGGLRIGLEAQLRVQAEVRSLMFGRCLQGAEYTHALTE